MKKLYLVIILSICFSFIGCTESVTKESEKSQINEVSNSQIENIEDTKEYMFNNALEKGNMIVKTTFDGEKESNKVYNKSSMDQFIDNIEKRKKSDISIVQYLDQDGNLSINKLYKLMYDGDEVIVNYYDVITDKKNFELKDTVKYKKLNAEVVGENLKYLFTDENGNEVKLISFSKNDIIN